MSYITSEQLFPAGQDTIEVNGTEIRKGTFAALVANVKQLDNPTLSDEERRQILDSAKTVAKTSAAAFDITEIITWKNSEIQAIFEQAAKQSKAL